MVGAEQSPGRTTWTPLPNHLPAKLPSSIPRFLLGALEATLGDYGQAEGCYKGRVASAWQKWRQRKLAGRFSGNWSSGARPLSLYSCVNHLTCLAFQAGWMGKGKTGAQEDPRDHRSRPLASLQDPEAFAPPPKNIRYHGGAAIPDTLTPDRSALGTVVQLKNPRGGAEAGRREAPSPPPPAPFGAGRTGLDTATLTKPPVYRPNTEVTPTSPDTSGGMKPKPSLPPRLPPRRNSDTSHGRSLPERPSRNAALQPQSILNRSALNSLSSAGVSVPGLGIGSQPAVTNPWQDEPSRTANRPFNSTFNRPQEANELQARFAKLSTLDARTPPDSPSQGTTFADKQAALKTASAFRNNPASVTLADGKTALSTANNFRERHGDQVAAGWQNASGLNKKYGIANKISSLTPDTAGASGPSAPSPPASPGALGSHDPHVKKPPPPPPKRIAGLTASGARAPPVPQGSKPKV